MVVELAGTSRFKSGLAAMQVWVQLPSRVLSPGNFPGFFYWMYFTYILYSPNNKRYYVGHCEDMVARLQRHNSKMVPSTKNYVPWELVYAETFATRSEANQRELYIKKQKSRKYIEQLISGGTGRHVPI
jgi:putative endonuclease